MNKYREGDRIKIKSWEEMVQEFGLVENAITFSSGFWDKVSDVLLPENRVITIDYFDEDGDPWFDGGTDYIYYGMIKCSENEYYLQQIKEELCLTEKQ